MNLPSNFRVKERMAPEWKTNFDTVRTGLQALIVGLTLCTFCACSSTGPKKANRISEYDTAFDPEEGDEEEVDAASIPEEPEALRRAKDAYDSGLYSLSREHWTTLRDQYPGSYYVALAELKIADTFFYAGDYASAIPAYEEFVRLHPAHEAVPYSRYQIAEANRLDYKGVLKDQSPLQAALRAYQQVITNYPKSEFVTAARRKVDECREHLAKHEAAVAQFYLKQGLYEAGAGRLAALERGFPDSDATKSLAERVREGESALELTTAETEAVNRSQGGGWETMVERKAPVVAATQTSAPGAPELVVARGDEAKELADLRYRLKTPKSEASSDAVRRPETPKLPERSSLLVALLCEAAGDDAVFTAIFREPVQRFQSSSPERGAIIAKKALGQFQRSNGDVELVDSCAVSGSELKFTRTSAQDADTQMNYGLEVAPGKVVTALELDRPYRVVFVVQSSAR